MKLSLTIDDKTVTIEENLPNECYAPIQLLRTVLPVFFTQKEIHNELGDEPVG